jgi:hypothetical protein
MGVIPVNRWPKIPRFFELCACQKERIGVFAGELAHAFVLVRYRGVKKNKKVRGVGVGETRTFSEQPPGSLRSQPSLPKEGSVGRAKRGETIGTLTSCAFLQRVRALPATGYRLPATGYQMYHGRR